MNLSPNAIGIIKDIGIGTQVAYAVSKDGQTLEFKMKYKVKQLQAQDIINMCNDKWNLL